jgi:hypothetical protein
MQDQIYCEKEEVVTAFMLWTRCHKNLSFFLSLNAFSAWECQRKNFLPTLVLYSFTDYWLLFKHKKRLGALSLLTACQPTRELPSFPSFRDFWTKNVGNEQQLWTVCPCSALHANSPQCSHTSCGTHVNKIPVPWHTFSPAYAITCPHHWVACQHSISTLLTVVPYWEACSHSESHSYFLTN